MLVGLLKVCAYSISSAPSARIGVFLATVAVWNHDDERNPMRLAANATLWP